MANVVYWSLLAYIVAALIFWCFELVKQSRKMSTYKLLELKPHDPDYPQKVEAITREAEIKYIQYVGEGVIFLLFILVAALFVYRAVKKQILLSHQQQNFMMAVTHELKTPIAVAKLNLETLLKHKLDEQKQQKMLQMTLAETNRLDALASNILISSQLEGGGYHISKEEIDFSALVAASVQDFKNRFPDRPWQVEIEPDITLLGDTLLLQILTNNLLDNAIKYSPKTSPINTTLTQEADKVLLQVKDEGPGIPVPERKRIFDRFYRIGNETVRTAKGTGLGLYLCRKIALDHNADISVTNNNPVGSNFTIYFKL